MKKDSLEKLLSSSNDNSETVHVALTKEDLLLINAALHSHKRSEIAYLFSIKDAMTQDALYQFRQEIENKCQSIKEKLFASQTTP